tara:strand:- start:22 stop:570 length:549 start_codon:yes stop_codon:yes gene_type:complete
MEIKYSEYDKLDSSRKPSVINDHVYWEQDAPKKETKRVSFDHILNGMNLVVDKSGTLKFATLKPTMEEDVLNSLQRTKSVNYDNDTPNSKPLTSVLKHSSIYNKYFKDYEDLNAEQPQVRVPKTMEEYKKMLWDDRVKKIKHQQLMSQIKPKQLLFVSNKNNINNRQPITPTKNGLKKMSFN